MNTRRSWAVALVLALMGSTTPTSLWAAQQGSVSLSGTAKDEAKKPYGDYTARARDVRLGQIAGMTGLDPSGNFALSGLQPDRKSTRLNSSHIQKSRMPSSA